MIKKKVLTLPLLMILIISFVFNYDSTAKYIERFPESVQNISTATWKVDSAIEHEGELVEGQTIENFKPGDSNVNSIKLYNHNNYKTRFILEVHESGISEEDNLFLNSNIKLSIVEVDGINGEITTAKEWNSVYGEKGSKIYTYEVELLPNSNLQINMFLTWESGDNDILYAEKGGVLIFKIRAEQSM